MTEPFEKVQVLPVHFAAVDLEKKTKPIALVACPRHPGEERPLAFCGKCGHCQQVAVASQDDVALACNVVIDEPDREPRDCTARLVHDFARVPTVCVAFDTPLALLIQQLSRQPCELVPVLDYGGRLVGVVLCADLQAACAIVGDLLDATSSDLMSAAPRSIRFDATETDAVRMLGHDRAGCLAVTNARGRFLGILAREDLSGHA